VPFLIAINVCVRDSV